MTDFAKGYVAHRDAAAAIFLCCYLQEQIAKGKAVMPTTFSSGNSSGYAAAAQDTDNDEHRDWADFYEDYVDAELEEDEEIEQYYFSSAAGRARVVLGNRRWGEGGYMRAGEQQWLRRDGWAASRGTSAAGWQWFETHGELKFCC